MKKLHFKYNMQIDYSNPISKCYFTIKCIPKNTKRQNIENVQIKLSPDVPYSCGTDGLKNKQIYGADYIEHTSFIFSIEGDAETGLNNYEEEADESFDMIFACPHGLNVAGDNIKSFFSKLSLEVQDDLSKANNIMNSLHDKFSYKTGSTNVDTGAEEAFTQGFGVCQDYAHIFISLLHLANINARYVTGFIIGEGQSHAWVEVLCGSKWYGLDPTHNKAVDDNYIKIGIGRDAKDCTINRGIMHGECTHTQSVFAQVREE